MPRTYEYNKKYVKTYMAKFERIGIKVPKGKRELLKSYAEKHSESVNELINRLIDAELGGADEGKIGRSRATVHTMVHDGRLPADPTGAVITRKAAEWAESGNRKKRRTRA